MGTALAEMTFTVNGLLAFQQIAQVSVLPAHLRIRPQLLRLTTGELDISAEDYDVLREAGLVGVGGANPDAVTALRALAFPDAEINVTLGGAQRNDTYICLVRRHALFVAAARCGDDVTIDAYTHLTEADVVDMIAQTVRQYMFGDEEPDGIGIERCEFPMHDVHTAMTTEEPANWPAALAGLGISRNVATALLRSETELVTRAEVSAYLNHEVIRSNPDTILRVTALSDGALMTSFATDNNERRWLTVEDYHPDRLSRAVLGAIKSVPGSSWFSHSRSD